VELIVRETNTYAAQKTQARRFIPLHSRMRDWKPVTKDEMYVVLALFMQIGIIQKPTLRSYFSKICILATPIFGSIISMDQFESICNFMHFNNNDNIGTYQRRFKLFKIYPEKKARPTRRCVVCNKNNRRKETVFWCPKCEAALCVEEGFKAFYTKLNF